MARYFFDIHNSRFSALDEFGLECADQDAVSAEALRQLCTIAKDEPLSHLHGTLGAIVRNYEHHVVLTATVSLSITWVDGA
ncbi:DUF6894 family protein [Methylobacterium dankookense]|uniref:DUF6894 family protein n=1 Tax=Methylobacterium dankookense TaxID=560405 RepID=UPI00357161C8